LSRQTIARILGEAGIPPVPDDDIDTWDSFLKRHAATLFECDFCTKRMWTLRGPIDLYLLVFLHLGTRRMWITPCTPTPDSAWVAQQARNFQMIAEDAGLTAKYLVHDNDTKFTNQFDDLFESAGTEVVKTAIQAPNQQAHIERAIQTLQFEVLDAFVVVAERHLNHICKQAVAWYNGERGHGGRDHLPPAWEKPPEPAAAVESTNLGCTTRLGGFLRSYSRRAASHATSLDSHPTRLRPWCELRSTIPALEPPFDRLTANHNVLPLVDHRRTADSLRPRTADSTLVFILRPRGELKLAPHVYHKKLQIKSRKHDPCSQQPPWHSRILHSDILIPDRLHR
jgi:hypothetical protein